jgi:Skp family chaperone for outer membrane proteins
MGLKEVLSKMKIVEIDPDEAAAAVPPAAAMSAPGGSGPRDLPPPPSMPKDIRDLLGTIPEPPAIDERKLPPESADEGGDIPDFPAIYRAAGVVDPPHGYSAYKVLEIFASPGFTALDLRAKAAALTGFLNMSPSGPVPITDVVQDAVRRDQALDRFEEFLRNKLGARSEQIDKESAQLQAEIDEVTRRNREKMEANRAALEAEQARFTRWLNTKRAEERKLFDAVNPFVEQNPISTADTPRPAAPTPEKAQG